MGAHSGPSSSRKLSPIPVVILSAMVDVAEAAHELAVADHVTKPVRLERLVEITDRFCPRVISWS